MKIELLGKKVAIQVEEEKTRSDKYETTEGGIFVAQQEQPQRVNPAKTGKLTHIGAECVKGYKEGEEVLFLGHQSTELDFEGTKFHILDEEFLVAKVIR